MSDSNATQGVTETTPHERRCQCDERWQALPAVIRATIEWTRKVSMYQSLRALDVPVVPSRAVEWAYESGRGPLVVTVWHDHIEQETDGSLGYRIAPLEWQAGHARLRRQSARCACVSC